MPTQLSTAASTLLAIAMLGVGALIWGGVTFIRRGDRQKGVLMLMCAVVVLGNVMIWTV